MWLSNLINRQMLRQREAETKLCHVSRGMFQNKKSHLTSMGNTIVRIDYLISIVWFSILARCYHYLSGRTKPSASPILMHREYMKWDVWCQKQVSRAWTSNYIPQKLWDVITCPCPWYLLLAQQSWNVYISFIFWHIKFSISINTWHQVFQKLDHINIFCYDMKKFH